MIEPNTVFICEPHLKLITGAHNVFHTDGSIHSPAAQTQVYFGEASLLDSGLAVWVQGTDDDHHRSARRQPGIPL